MREEYTRGGRGLHTHGRSGVLVLAPARWHQPIERSPTFKSPGSLREVEPEVGRIVFSRNAGGAVAGGPAAE